MNSEITVEGICGLSLPVTAAALPQWHQDVLYQDSPTMSTRKRQRFCTPPSTPPRIYRNDRFIPSRASLDLDLCSYMMADESTEEETVCASLPTSTPPPGSLTTPRPPRVHDLDNYTRYTETLASNLLYQSPNKHKTLLHFHDNGENTPTAAASPSSVSSHPSLRHMGGLGGLHSTRLLQEYTPTHRHIPSSPMRILDAPELRDDYYLNLVSWGNNNVLAVALGQIVYLYNTETSAIHEIKACTGRNDYVTSVAWISCAITGGSGSGAVSTGGNSHCLAIGTSHAELQIWDVAASVKVRTIRGHTERIGALAWNGQTLSSGSRDSRILHHDMRNITSSASVVATFSGHHQEICGLAWSPDGKTLASGGNDNMLCVWDTMMLRPHTSSTVSARQTSTTVAPRQRFSQHKAAVKALAWCPWERHLLASGGGTADRTIKFWQTGTGQLLNSVPTGSQVCGLVWSKSERELLSSHGFSQNELCLWKYPTMVRMREFTGHTARVLHLAMSPDGTSVVSAAADETLRFWNLFASSKRPSTPSLRHSTRRQLFPEAVIR